MEPYSIEMAEKQPKTSKVCVPTEIVQEILFRLPVVSLLRCKCVCKLWFSLISDPYFINRHVKNNEYAHHLLLLTIEPINIKTCHVYDILHDKTVVNAFEIDHPFKDNVESAVWVVGSCNGLLCLRSRDYSYCIWNPSTRRSSKRFSCCLRSKAHCDFGIGFAYDESTDDYKVVELCYTSEDTLTTHIYSLKSGKWQNSSQSFQGIMSYYSGTFLNGALHWLAGISRVSLSSVATLDLATETYCVISHLPYDEDDDKGSISIPQLGAFGEWLCVLRTYLGKHEDFWVMKEYGAKNSWIKLFSIQIPTHFKIHPFGIFVPLCFLDDGKIFMHFGPKLVVYDLKNSSLLEIQSVDKWWDAITFVESLVSPDSIP